MGGGTPAAGDVTIYVTQQYGAYGAAAQTTTDSNGDFVVTGLGPGEYGVNFEYTGSGPYGDVTWGQSYSAYPTFTELTSSPLTGVDAVLPMAGPVGGTVDLGNTSTSAGSGAVTVTAVRRTWNGTAWDFLPTGVAATTDSTGHFSFPQLRPSQYRLMFHVNTGAFQDIWQDQVIVPGGGASLPATVLDPLRTATGHIYLGGTATPAGAGDVTVSLSTTDNNGATTPAQNTTTDASGAFTFTGLYDNWSYVLTYTYVKDHHYLTTTQTSSLSALYPPSITIPAVYQITGHVSLGTTAVAAGAGDVRATLSYLGSDEGTAVTDASGNYVFSNLHQGTYSLSFHYLGSKGSYSDYNFTRDCSSLCGIFVNPDAVGDVTLAQANLITGTVTASGGPVAGVTVEGDRYSSAGDYLDNVTTTTAADGTYQLGNLTDGQYMVTFFPTGNSYAAQSWNDVSPYYESDLVNVLGGQVVPDIDATLQYGGSVTGHVLGAADYLSGHVQVEVLVFDGSTSSWVGTGDTYPVASDGSYRIDGLPADDYIFEATYTGAAGNKGQDSPIVHVTASSTATVDIRLAQNLPSGSPIGSLDSASAGPSSISVSGWALDPDTYESIPVQFYLDGINQGQTQADQSRPDIAAAHPGYGQSHGYALTLVGVSAGPHTLCAYGINTGASASNTTLGCRSVTIHAQGIKGSIDSITAGPGTVTVTGWVFDWSSSASAAVSLSGDSNWGANSIANGNRPDIAAAYPGYGAAHGFTIVATGVPAGSHYFCLSASVPTTVVGGVTMLNGYQFFGQDFNSRNFLATGGGCPTVTVPPSNPFGSLDSVTTAGPGSATVSGWAIDPDVSSSIPVHVYVDGAPVIALTADGARPDIGAAYPSLGSAHGYTTTLTGLAAGTHQVCTYGINQGAGTGNSQLGCRSLTIRAGNPFGSLDAATVTGFGSVALSGWGIDPDTTASISAHVYVDGAFSQIVTADGTRSDLAAAFPGYGSAHGISATVTGLSGGSHTICLYGINQLAGTTNPQLGCRTVTLPTGSPLGSVDTATPAAGSIALTGWTLDPDTTASISVHVYVDGTFDGVYSANGTRSDIAAAFPGYGSSHGFSISAPASVGTHTVCAYAIDQAAPGSNSSLGCRTVKVTAAATP